ncbi:non-specific lipid-transfer protein-like protein At2g13820, partial [Vitis riparia]|uniref:non-specific lipid-transfer protein-like protein At2g13820 n=1 Tax=Vitis riparia TaxID=96939 RepID=UPI00155A8A45
TPSSSCCSQLASVVQSQPQCLCLVLNGGGATLGINVNQTLALALPGACYVQTPLASQCNAASGPTTSATSPGSSPADSSDDTPEVPTTPSESAIPSGAGSKTVTSTDGSSSDGGIMDSPLHFVVLLFITSCVSTFTGF